MAECNECKFDEEQLAKWRRAGGRMPDKLCERNHGKVCKRCKETLTRNPSRRCDDCFNEHWKKERGFMASLETKAKKEGTL